jgi:hypothetical protein
MIYKIYNKYISSEINSETNKNYIDYYIGNINGQNAFIFHKEETNLRYTNLDIIIDDNFFDFLKKSGFKYDNEYIFDCELFKMHESYIYTHRVDLDEKIKNILNR